MMASPTGWADWPRWLRGALIAGGAGLVGLWLLGRRAARLEEESGDAALRAAKPKRRPGQRFIVLAGRERVGKSAVGNALLGTSLFGPEAKSAECGQWRGAWWVRELPAPALSATSAELWREQVTAEDLVVLVIDEQLFRRERLFLERIAAAVPDVPVWVVVNKEDLLLRQYTADEAEQVKESVRDALSPHGVARADVVWTSAGAPDGAVLDALRTKLEALVG